MAIQMAPGERYKSLSRIAIQIAFKDSDTNRFQGERYKSLSKVLANEVALGLAIQIAFKDSSEGSRFRISDTNRFQRF